MESIEAVLYITLALLVLGVLLAFSPTIIITEIAVLTKSNKPFLHSLCLMAGVATPITLFGIFAVAFIDTTARIPIPSTRHILDILPILDVFIGVLFIIGGMQLRKDAEKPRLHSATKDVTVFTSSKLYWLGCIRTATRLSGVAAILLAAQLIKQNSSSGVYSLIGVAWLVIVALAPLIFLLMLQRSDSKYFAKITTYSNKVASLSWRKIISYIIIIIGILMIFYGIFFA